MVTENISSYKSRHTAGRLKRNQPISPRRQAHYPDTGFRLLWFKVPDWDVVLDISSKCSAAIGLGYLGCDIILDENDGPMVIEVNAHPGIEIQNINQKGLRAKMIEAGEKL
ncbi:sugar-transfer associated ATP-grasp domain-containing protein [Aurantiacibacter arachoides]|uniref:sugar-transfer associated ATP-grasp domain-containing protein n=1 Tax=Aurantiacibacter arachoides TaxID=1850444 RepID=UPI00103B8908|nr:sugar-transfer associated ATP-grasp domain-containing protein [Aurantiacibacter arachoides]